MTLENLDSIDRKILSELDKNARISYSELGKKIRVAKETIKYRIKKLEYEGIIKGYYAAINFSKLGYNIYRLYLRLQNTSPQIEKQIDSYLISSKQTAVFYKINGPFHIALGIWAKDNWEYEEFWAAFKQEFGEYVSESKLSFFTEYCEFSRQYFTKQQEKLIFTAFSRTPADKMDEIDYKLLSYLSNNARASLVVTATALQISIVTVHHHLKNLISKKIITGFRTNLNLQKLGKEYYKVDLWFKKFGNEKEFRSLVLSNPNVIYAEKSIGGSDFEFDVEIENFESFIRLMNSFKEKFPEHIRDYKYYSLVKVLKVNYAPAI